MGKARKLESNFVRYVVHFMLIKATSITKIIRMYYMHNYSLFFGSGGRERKIVEGIKPCKKSGCLSLWHLNRFK